MTKRNDLYGDGAIGERLEAMKIAAATLAVTLVVATIAWEATHYFAMPMQDDVFDRLRFYRALPGGLLDLLKYLASAHNEHRIATTRLFTLLDELAFGGREYTQIIATNVFSCFLAFVVYRFAFRAYVGQGWNWAQKCLVFTSLSLLFINPNLLYTLIVPFQLQHVIMALLAILSAILVSRAPDPPMTAADGLRLVFALIALAVVGTFTLGNSPAMLIAAVATALALRWPLRLTSMLVALAVAHTAIVLATTRSVGNASYDIADLAKFSLIYWGSPFLRFQPWPAPYATWASWPYLAAAFGAAVPLVAAAFWLLRWLRPGFGGRLGIFGLTILTIVIVTGLAAAHSRSQFGVLEAANKKYASFAALGWLGLLAVLVGIAHQGFGHLRWLATGVFAVFLAIMLPLSALAYDRETRIWQKMVDRNWEASLAVFLHVNAWDRLREIYIQGAGLAEYIGYIEPKGRSIFSYFPFRWGDDATGLLSKRSETACRGEVEAATPIQTSGQIVVFHDPGTALSISGWAWMGGDQAPPQTVLAVDANRRIVGVARMTRSSSRAEEWLGQKFHQDLGWFGFARVTDPRPLAFFALSRDGRSFCRLGRVGSVR